MIEEILSCETRLILIGGLDHKGEPKASKMAHIHSHIIGDIINRSGRDSLEKDRSISHSIDRISSFVQKKKKTELVLIDLLFQPTHNINSYT